MVQSSSAVFPVKREDGQTAYMVALRDGIVAGI